MTQAALRTSTGRRAQPRRQERASGQSAGIVASTGAAEVLALQRAVGNQAVVQYVLQRKVDVLPEHFFGRLMQQRRTAAIDEQTATRQARGYVYLKPVNQTDMRTFPEEVQHVSGFTEHSARRALQAEWQTVEAAVEPAVLSDERLGLLEDQTQGLVNAVHAAERKISMRPADLKLDLAKLFSKASGNIDITPVLDLIGKAPEFERAAVGSDSDFLGRAIKHLRDEDVAPFSLALGARARGPRRNKLQALLRASIFPAADDSLAFAGAIDNAIRGATPDEVSEVRDDRLLLQTALLKLPQADYTRFTTSLNLNLSEVIDHISKPGVPFGRVLAVVQAASDVEKGTILPVQEKLLIQQIEKPPLNGQGADALKTRLRTARRQHPPAARAKRTAAPGASDAEMRHVSANLADRVIATALQPYVSGALKRGKTLIGNTAILPHDAFEKVAASLAKPPGLNAFQDKGRMYINATRGDPGTVIHEAIHQYADDAFLSKFGMFPNEGLTEHFALRAIGEVPDWNIQRSQYLDELVLARKMIALLGEPLLARVVFDGKLSELETAYMAKRNEQGRNGQQDWSSLIKAALAETWDAFSRLL